jgi:heme oxygenase (biliverdin-IX-beta and delta-forming)
MTAFEQFLSDLRSRTQATHTALEALPLSRVMMSDTLTPDAYVRYLQAAYVMHSAVETTVFPCIEQVISDTEDRRKLPLLESDLRAYGAEPADTDFSFLDEAYESSVPFNLGIVYVIEGSTLGGRFLLKNAKKTLGETVAASYFDAYGERTGSFWKGFLQQLEAYHEQATAADREAILRGAVYGFDRTAALFGRFSEAAVSGV